MNYMRKPIFRLAQFAQFMLVYSALHLTALNFAHAGTGKDAPPEVTVLTADEVDSGILTTYGGLGIFATDQADTFSMDININTTKTTPAGGYSFRLRRYLTADEHSFEVNNTGAIVKVDGEPHSGYTYNLHYDNVTAP